MITVIPIFKKTISQMEISSLECAIEKLKEYKIVVIAPESLDISLYKKKYPTLSFEFFSDQYFDDLRGYNKLMLSKEFYSRFIYSKYILIYQLDAYIFKNDLEYWILKDYDYVGAPWPKRKVYNNLLFKIYFKFTLFFTTLLRKPNRQEIFEKVGNGGFSLRKTEPHLKAVTVYEREIREMLSKKRHHLYNEDVFFGYRVNNLGKMNFSIPDFKESLKFSFDKNPELCYKINQFQLPMGCHGWSKEKYYPFWKQFIK